MKLLVISFLIFFLASGVVYADLGPKPEADIQVTLNGRNVPDSVFNAEMLVCYKEGQNGFGNKEVIPQLNISEYDSANDCYWKPAPLAWSAECRNSSCHFGYMLPSSFKLAVYIPSLDKVFITNEVSRTNFNSEYDAELSSSGSAVIRETTPLVRKDNITSFVKALIITLILELLTALIFVLASKLTKKMLITVFVANIISLPIVWFFFPLIKLVPLVILLSEIFAVVFEMYFIYLIHKKTISLKKSFILSILMNLASFVLGGLIFLFFLIFFGF